MKESSIFLSSCFRREGIKLVKKERDGNVNVSIDQRGRLLIGHIPWPRSCASRLALIHAQIEFHDSDSRARSIIAHGRRDRYIGARFHGDISRSPLSATGLMNFLAGYRGPPSFFPRPFRRFSLTWFIGGENVVPKRVWKCRRCLLFADFSIEIVSYLIIMESGPERVPISNIVDCILIAWWTRDTI